MLIALRGCSLNQAFVEIVQTAKRHHVSTLSLADALLAMAQTQTSQNIDDAAFAAARATWGHLLDRTGPDRTGPRRAAITATTRRRRGRGRIRRLGMRTREKCGG